MRALAYLAVLSSLLTGSGASAMTYALVPFQDGTAAVLAQGQIAGNETARLLAVLQEAQARGLMPRTLIISSPGGSLASALDLGQSLRQLGLQTTVGALAQDASGQRQITAGQCHSACVMVLMAGVGRSVLPGSRIGVHSPQTRLVVQGRQYVLDEATSRFMVQQTEPALRSYARHMGVSPALIDVAHRVPHTSIRTLTASELVRYGLVTSGSGRRAAPASAARRSAAMRQRGRT